MKIKKTAAPNKTDQAAKALARARENVKAVKKRVKDAKAVLKAARSELKEAKQARKVAEAQREAQLEKRTRRRVTATAGSSTTPTAPKIVALRLRRRPAKTAEVAADTPTEQIGIAQIPPPESLVEVSELERAQAH